MVVTRRTKSPGCQSGNAPPHHNVVQLVVQLKQMRHWALIRIAPQSPRYIIYTS